MYKRMLVPLDGCEQCEVVFPYAKELAGRLDLDVILLHVSTPEERELAPLHWAYIERKAEIIKRLSEEVQQNTGIGPGGKAVQVRGELVVGYPAGEILRYVEENDVDLILMASHGRSGIGCRRFVLGGVAEKVLHESTVPVWLVRAGIPEEIVYDKWPRKTMVVPLDGSELAEAVLPHVEALAKQRGAEPVDMVLLRVLETVEPKASEELTHMVAAKRRAQAEEYLAGVVEKRLKDAGLTVRSEVRVGKPAEQIIDYADATPFSLIMMSTHARSGISRWAYGSVALRVLHTASRPMLLVRPH